MLKRDKPIWNAATGEAYRAVLKKKLKKVSTIEQDMAILKGMFIFYNNFMNHYGFMDDDHFEHLKEVLNGVGKKKYSVIDVQEKMSSEDKVEKAF